MEKFSCKIKKLLVLGTDPSFLLKKKRVWKPGLNLHYISTNGDTVNNFHPDHLLTARERYNCSSPTYEWKNQILITFEIPIFTQAHHLFDLSRIYFLC